MEDLQVAVLKVKLIKQTISEMKIAILLIIQKFLLLDYVWWFRYRLDLDILEQLLQEEVILYKKEMDTNTTLYVIVINIDDYLTERRVNFYVIY